MDIAILKADMTYDAIKKKVCDISVLYQKLFRNNKITFFEIREGLYPSRVYDLYVITGSAASAYEKTPWIEKLKNFVRENQNKHFLGICFGHQIIASALGGQVKRANYGWNLGLKPLCIINQKTWMNPSSQNINMIFNHRDQVIQLPKNATLLAGDNIVPIQMYSVKNNILCMQGHPEFTRDYQTALMDHIHEVIGDQQLINIAKKSYQKDHVPQIIFQWIENFFRNSK